MSSFLLSSDYNYQIINKKLLLIFRTCDDKVKSDGSEVVDIFRPLFGPLFDEYIYSENSKIQKLKKKQLSLFKLKLFCFLVFLVLKKKCSLKLDVKK